MNGTDDHQADEGDTEGVPANNETDVPMRPEDKQYFDGIETELAEAMAVAGRARNQGKDPETTVEISIAKDMPARVENILGISGVANRLRELESDYTREEGVFILAEDFDEGRLGDYEDPAGKIEGAARTAVAVLNDGVTAASIEGIDRVELRENDDGSEFVTVHYARPIRLADGTAQALSVLVADYTRSILGVGGYKTRQDEIERYVEDLSLYDSEIGLQYIPTDKENRFIASNMPIKLNGEATGDQEVAEYRDLDSVDTNAVRGGMCLVAAEGIALKATKIQRYARQLDGVEWSWLEPLLNGTIRTDTDGSDAAVSDEAADEDGTDETADTADEANNGNEKQLEDLTDGLPVFSPSSETSGFRLRYGRARNLGVGTAGIHPATMYIIDDFLDSDTEIKPEDLRETTVIVPVDSINGPTVRLDSGEIRRIDDLEDARELSTSIEKILDFGEYLVNYGEFIENHRPLAPAAYATEWWQQEFKAAGADVQALKEDGLVDLQEPSASEALQWAMEYDCPLHPIYTYLWHDISGEEFTELATAVADATVKSAATVTPDTTTEQNGDNLLVIDRTESVRKTLESLLVAHHQTETTLEVGDWRPLAQSLGLNDDRNRTWDTLSTEARDFDDGDSAIKAVNEVAPFDIRERAPTRIGVRMGQPELSEKQDLSPAVHTVFPVSEAGGTNWDMVKAAGTEGDQEDRGVHDVRVSQRQCPDCGAETFTSQCPNCSSHTKRHYECDNCEIICEPDESGHVECPQCGQEVTAAGWATVDLQAEYRDALDAIDEREEGVEVLKGVQELKSADKTPEAMEKGILRAKHDVSAFTDGTARYEMTELPVTAVKPSEIGVTVDRLREFGYDTDIDGDPLRHDDQVVELKIQDVVLSEEAAEHMRRTAGFVDDLLERFYELPPFYDIENRDGLIGELVFGMAPQMSAAVVGRVIGVSEGVVGCAHPYFQAAKYGNSECFEDSVMLLMDGLLNFSRQFLPAKRGGSIDAPLVLSSQIDPTDMDTAVHNMDIVSTYPADFYEATRKSADPQSTDIQTVADILDTTDQYHGFEHTHGTSNIHKETISQ